MEVFKNRVRISQKQTFSLHKIVQFNDGSPAIISSELNEPYLVLSLSTSQFIKEKKFIRRWWDKVDDAHPRFYTTTPIEVAVGYEIIRDVSPGNDYFTWFNRDLGIYEHRNQTNCVFRTIGTNNFFYGIWNGATVQVVPYEFTYDKIFFYDDIKDLQGLNYVYDIRVIDGINNIQYLYQIADEYLLKNNTSPFTFTMGLNEYNAQFYDKNGEQRWWYWQGPLNINYAINDLMLMSENIMKQFLRSASVLTFIGKDKRKEFLATTDLNLDIPIAIVDYENVYMRPTDFDVISSVEGGNR